MIRRWLLGLVGVRDDLLRQVPGDRFRYIAMAGVLLTTAAIAAVSATFALRMVVQAPIALAVALGIGWGIVILNLDRLLMLGMVRRSGWKANLGAAVPRLVLAILLGVVISTPLVLRIFEKEIGTEIQVIHAAKETDFVKSFANNPEFNQIPDLEKKLADLNVIAAGGPGAVDMDPAVVKAAEEVRSARERFDKAHEEKQCELLGQCGSGVPGKADAYYSREEKERLAREAYDAAQAALEGAKAQARASVEQKANEAKRDAAGVRAELDRRVAARNTAIDNHRREQANDDGLLIRLQALGQIGDKHSDAAWAQRLLFLLFLAIEVLPVAIKLLHLLGPQTEYEKLSARTEAAEQREAARAMSRRESANELLESLRIDLEEDQARRQYAAGLRANEMLVAEQSTIAEDEIRRWADRETTDRRYRRPGEPPDPPTEPLFRHRDGRSNDRGTHHPMS